MIREGPWVHGDTFVRFRTMQLERLDWKDWEVSGHEGCAGLLCPRRKHRVGVRFRQCLVDAAKERVVTESCASKMVVVMIRQKIFGFQCAGKRIFHQVSAVHMGVNRSAKSIIIFNKRCFKGMCQCDVTELVTSKEQGNDQ